MPGFERGDKKKDISPSEVKTPLNPVESSQRLLSIPEAKKEHYRAIIFIKKKSLLSFFLLDSLFIP
jgi:hypothetical protein